jgi:hypothetical protein
MGTKLTIAPDVEQLLQDAAKKLRKTVDEVLNETVRRALAQNGSTATAPYVLQPRQLGLQPGIKLDKALSLADELEDEQRIRQFSKG